MGRPQAQDLPRVVRRRPRAPRHRQPGLAARRRRRLRGHGGARRKLARRFALLLRVRATARAPPRRRRLQAPDLRRRRKGHLRRLRAVARAHPARVLRHFGGRDAGDVRPRSFRQGRAGHGAARPRQARRGPGLVPHRLGLDYQPDGAAHVPRRFVLQEKGRLLQEPQRPDQVQEAGAAPRVGPAGPQHGRSVDVLPVLHRE
mmetsp:Transcript_7583/g.24733  ORF Transcript_7583/g.24733 Transcript_7583/m.24733 type:complete len:202 (-) Transcript_7583:647-1252(-)